MMSEVEVEKADTTGAEMKSTMNPILKTPSKNSTQPQTNVIIMTYSTGFSKVYDKVMIDISDVGPMETSRTVPKIT